MKTPNDIRSHITNTIVEAIENGTMPWQRPWAATDLGSMPLRENGEPYKGINSFWLGLLGMINGYGSPYWMTFKAAKRHGGHVRKGEKSEIAIFYSTIQKEDEDTGEMRTIRFLKSYRVFNVAQIDGLPERFYGTPVTEQDRIERIAKADRFFNAIPAQVSHGGNAAAYSPTLDAIRMPPADAFVDAPAYYGTLAHELAHWTGHKTRLDRLDPTAKFGSPDYATEELVAELSASFTLGHLEIASSPRDDHAAYIASWLKALKANNSLIFSVAARASEATDYLIEQAQNQREDVVAAVAAVA